MDWLSDIFAPFISIGKSIYHFVWHVVHSVVNWAISIVDDAIHGIFSAVTDLWQFADSVWTKVLIFVEQLGHRIDAALVEAANWVGSVFHTVTSLLAAWVNDLIHMIETGLADLGAAIMASVDFVWHTLVDPLWHWFQSAASWVAGIIASWWNTVYRDVIGPILSTIGWVLANVPQALDYLWNVVRWYVELVIKAADWLVWMAAHSLSDIVALVESTPPTNGIVRQGMARMTDGQALSMLDENISKILG